MNHHRRLTWIIAYLGVIAAALYPAIHESFGIRIALWNCIPPTLGLLLVMASLGKSRSKIVASVLFASITGATAIFFFCAWFFARLDTDPHSFTTKLVFIYAPIVSIALAVLGAFVGWLAAADMKSTATAAKES